MKLLYHFRTQGTGAEAVHIAGVAQGFKALGFSVVFSSPSGTNPALTAGRSPFRAGRWAPVLRFVPGFVFELLELAYNLSGLVANLRCLRREPFTLIYERHAFFLFSTAFLAKRFAIPLVVEVNELVGDERVRPQPKLAFLARYLDRVLFQRASAIVVVSPHLRRKIIGMGIASEKVLVMPNGVARADLEKLTDGHELRRQLCLEGSIVVGFVGWFVPWHRLDNLLNVIAAMIPEFRGLRLLLVGEGPMESALRETAARLGITNQVLFVGPVPHSEISRYVSALDIAVVPHSNEFRSPIKLFEYMAQARAVVAPNTEPIATVVKHGETGLLFEVNGEPSLRQCLVRLADNADERHRFGEAARKTIQSGYTWEHNAERVWKRIRDAKVSRSLPSSSAIREQLS